MRWRLMTKRDEGKERRLKERRRRLVTKNDDGRMEHRLKGMRRIVKKERRRKDATQKRGTKRHTHTLECARCGVHTDSRLCSFPVPVEVTCSSESGMKAYTLLWVSHQSGIQS